MQIIVVRSGAYVSEQSVILTEPVTKGPPGDTTQPKVAVAGVKPGSPEGVDKGD